MKSYPIQNNSVSKALIYCRVSSDRQATEGHGLDGQEQRCKKYAEDNGYHVEKVFRDSYTGGGDFMNRPAMALLIKYLDEKRFDNFVVIFDDIKRFARDTAFHLQLRSTLKARGARPESPNFRFDETPEGRFVETVIAAGAELERHQGTRQVVQKMKARLELGYWTNSSKVPGYVRKNLHGRDWILARREPQASIIQEALEGYADNRFDTKVDVQRFLQSKNYLADNKNKRVYLSKVDRLLKRSWLYAGYIQSDDFEVVRREGNHEAIISRDTLRKIEDKLQDKRRVRIRQDYNGDFPLRPYVLCAGCGKKLTASWTRSRNKNYHAYYRCSNNSKVCPYGNKSIPKEVIENDFRDLLKNIHPTQQIIGFTKAVFSDLYEKKHSESKMVVNETSKAIRRLEEDIEKFTRRAVDSTNEVMSRRYESEAAKLIEEKEKLEEAAGERQSFDIHFGTAVEEVMSILNNPVNKWDSENLDDKRLVIKLVFNGDPVYDKIHGFGTTDLSCVIRLFEGIRATNYRDVEMGVIETPSESGTTWCFYSV